MDNMRNTYSLSHYSHRLGKLGRLQSLIQPMPVLPGDSFEINMEGIMRLTPMRREIVQEVQVDVCVFYVKHRHVYSSWEQMIREGYDTAVSLPTVAIALAGRNSIYMGPAEIPANTPTWLIEGYQRIWDRFYRVPHLPSDANYQTVVTGATPADDNYRKYGRLCARLPHILNTPTRTNGAGAASWRELTAADADVAAVATLDVRDLARVQGEYKSEVDKVFFNDRYADLMQDTWGTSVSMDGDERPELLWHHKFNMSGKDVDGTADANLGNFVGKSLAPIDIQIPRRKFSEHGAIWIVALARMPLINWRETHPLIQKPNNYELAIGDPAQYAARPPKFSNWTDWLVGTPAADSTEFQEAFGNHFRMHPSCVHPDFDFTAGYPWQNTFDTTGQAYYYHQDTEYDQVFQSSQLGHFQIHTFNDVLVDRHIPSPMNSINAGTH